MSTENNVAVDNGVVQTKRTRRAKSFPVLSFEEILPLGRIIQDHGVDGQMRRITVFDRLGKSPDSGPSRQLIITSNRYGLTSGGHQAEYLKLTDNGAQVLNSSATANERAFAEFELTIVNMDLFNRLYERLKNKRVPAMDVMLDEVAQLGVSPEDRAQCAKIFLANVQRLGLIQHLSGSDRLVPFEQLQEETTGHEIQPVVAEPLRPPHQAVSDPVAPRNTAQPTVHIDIQIHIDAAASAEQIDQIFGSMARHLYGNNSGE